MNASTKNCYSREICFIKQQNGPDDSKQNRNDGGGPDEANDDFVNKRNYFSYYSNENRSFRAIEESLTKMDFFVDNCNTNSGEERTVKMNQIKAVASRRMNTELELNKEVEKVNVLCFNWKSLLLDLMGSNDEHWDSISLMDTTIETEEWYGLESDISFQEVGIFSSEF